MVLFLSRVDGESTVGCSIPIPKLNSSIDAYGSIINSYWDLSKHSGVMHNLSNIIVELVSYAFSSSFITSFNISKYFFGSFPNWSILFFYPLAFTSFDLILANSPVNLKILINESFYKVLFSVFLISPIFCTAIFKNSSSDILLVSISANKSFFSSTFGSFSSTYVVCTVMASLSF